MITDDSMLRAQAEKKLTTVAADSGPRTLALLKAARQAPSAGARVVWLQRAVDAYLAPLAPVAACRDGCSHCCHIPVLITEHEARRIAAAAGREMVMPGAAISVEVLSSLDSQTEIDARLAPKEARACPFLQDGRCSVYDARPFMCRAQLSLADDGDVCDSATPAEVPYADTRQLKAIFLSAQRTALVADLRAWFPDQ